MFLESDTVNIMTSQVALVVQNLPANAGDAGSIPGNRKWQPTPVFLPGKFRGQRNLAGYSPLGCKELDMTEHGCVRSHTHN